MTDAPATTIRSIALDVDSWQAARGGPGPGEAPLRMSVFRGSYKELGDDDVARGSSGAAPVAH